MKNIEYLILMAKKISFLSSNYGKNYKKTYFFIFRLCISLENRKRGKFQNYICFIYMYDCKLFGSYKFKVFFFSIFNNVK